MCRRSLLKSFTRRAAALLDPRLRGDDRVVVMPLDKITVRPFREDEWLAYKAIRLKALQADPQAFGSSYERESSFDEKKWRERLTNPDAGTFGVFYDGLLIGLTGIYIDRALPDMPGVLVQSWLEKAWRGKGLSQKMYQARLDWARQRSAVRRVIVVHREGNLPSQKAIQKQGFVFTHTEDRTWSDGKTEPEYFYKLEL